MISDKNLKHVAISNCEFNAKASNSSQLHKALYSQASEVWWPMFRWDLSQRISSCNFWPTHVRLFTSWYM